MRGIRVIMAAILVYVIPVLERQTGHAGQVLIGKGTSKGS
jgi:hypothetical protein